MIKALTKARKNKKGLSGAVTALILVIASVIIALVVVRFAFGLFGAFGGTPTVTQVGTGTMIYSNGNYVAVITLHSTGNVVVENALISGVQTSPASVGASLSAGANTITISIASNDVSQTLEPGSTYTISLGLSDGQSVSVSVVYQ
ncbi:DUF973 family protein [Sulfurisphaera javensis]|uniref:DUF973 family protein n=1 Tax=Sulfurisphaera javensis TaxID=2049879 RepID=A0AAT9GQQ2_9CREN